MVTLKLGLLAEPKLVGRQRELDELLSSLDSAINGNGTTLLVSGEAGSGKTRLTSEFLNIARKKEVTVLTGWCLSNAAVPYFPFVEAFESFSSDNEAQAFGSQLLRMKSWLTETSWTGTLEKQGIPSPQIWKDQTFAAVTKELLMISTLKPTVLFIDDIHWADSASLSLLHYIARAINSERILIVATFRSEELTMNSEGQPRSLLETVRLMGREGLYEEIKLSNLSQSDVGQIVESMVGGNASLTLVEQLANESRGNPLFVVESVRMLYEQGSLDLEKGEWRLKVEKLGIPAKVKDVIERRLESLKSIQRRILETASVIGEKFDPKLVAEVVSQDSLDVLESLDSIAHSTLLVSCEGDYYRFDHAKSREMLYDKIPSLMKKEYHLRIGNKIESYNQIGKELPVSDLAYHFAQAGDKNKSVKYALAAGKDALAKFSNKEALKHFTFAVQIISEFSQNASETATALEGLGEAFFANSMFKEATRTFEQLSSIETGIMKLRALRRAMDAAFFQGEFVHLLELTKNAESLSSIDRLENARILMNKARAALFLGNQKAGKEDFEAALQVFEETCSFPDVARTLLGLGGFKAKTKFDKGLARALRAVTLYSDLGDVRGLMDACNRAGQSFGYRLLKIEALNMHREAIRIGEKIGDFNRVAEANVSSSWVLERTGEILEALSLSLKALEYSKQTDSKWIQGMTYANIVRLYSKIGDLKHAEEYFEKLTQLPQEVLNSTGFVRYGLSKAVYFAATNRCEEANHYFEACLRWLKKGINPAEEVLIRINYAWVLEKQSRAQEAKAQLKVTQKIFSHLEKCFDHTTINATLLTPREVELAKEFDMRLDVVNVSKKLAQIVGFEGVPSEFKVINVTSDYSCPNNGFITMKKNLEAFSVEPIKLSLKAAKSGIFNLCLRVEYIDELSQTKTFEINPVTITVKSALPTNMENKAETGIIKFEFKSEAAQKVFDFLINSFIEDYRLLRLPPERSGWRTLNQIVNYGKVSKHSVYGFSGHRGQVISELERCGIVEVRAFTGERGRGGKIFKIRAAYEVEALKKLIKL
jgi:predicted ATPase